MSIYVKDLFQLDIFKKFKIVAGQKGLNRRLEAAQVLDFEFVDDYKDKRAIMFDKNSFVLSSLLFAKGDETILMEAMKNLVDFGISAFAYKNVIYKQLPKEIIDFADNNNLPILEFQDEDAYFEDIIFSIMNLLKADSNISLIEEKIKEIINQELSKEEIESRIDAMNPNLQNKIQTFYVEIGDEKKVMNLLLSFNPPEKLESRCIFSKYKKDILFIFSTDKEDRNLQHKLEDTLFYLGLKKDDFKIAMSEVHEDRSKIKMALEEAVQAAIVGKIENKKVIKYEEIGIYQILLPEIKSTYLQKYMKRYLNSILNINEGESDLIKTAVQYVLAGGDLNAASNRLFCHKNTVRYRVNKIHELIDPQSNKMEFFEHLDVAIKIYLLNEYMN
ncbi:PucR family transcriptional regulator [Aminipila terrae]|uniref:PucR family transcriptional regulator n=1 Tax=Aminipila terrae TaxID=2697030 RepID=A0A6P1MN01_9FIRM|nr:PucR family transcriptional regulator [Aminipila terrae]QHI73468.1 hypothetical protein Ami3637_14755 [Aminipila terrae]